MGDLQTQYAPLNCIDVDYTTSHLHEPSAVPWDPVNWPAMVGFVFISYMVSTEVLFRTIYFARDTRSLFFWSLLAAAIGCILHASGSLLTVFVSNVPWAVAFVTLGWWAIVIGQLLVLCSRLKIVVASKGARWLIKVLVGIASVLLVPSTVTTVWRALNSTNLDAVASQWRLTEKIQLTFFLLAEAVLSLAYLTTHRVLKQNPTLENARAKSCVKLLIACNALMLTLSLVLLVIEFLDFTAIQLTLKPAVYAVKLKLELAFLTQLVNVSDGGFEFVRDREGRRQQRRRRAARKIASNKSLRAQSEGGNSDASSKSGKASQWSASTGMRTDLSTWREDEEDDEHKEKGWPMV